MSWSLCTSGAAIAKAGANASDIVIASGSILSLFSQEAEGRVCMECRKDWVTSSPTGTIAYAVEDVVSSMIAMSIISYDTTGYLSREADALLNVNNDRVVAGLKFLKEKEYQAF